jgi:flavin reductase (DIM6/NTAB) family NADH-FMN oxidoreductase RutF
VAEESAYLAVHCVPAGANDLADLFGGTTGDEIDKFACCAWHDGYEDLPLLDACPSWFIGRITEVVPVGDHASFILEPVVAHAANQEQPLTFHRAKRIDAGHPA